METMTTNELFLTTLSAQERNGVNYLMRIYNVSMQEAYKILKGEIEPPCVQEMAKANAAPHADSENPDPVNRKEYQCKYCGKKYRLNSHNRSTLYCYYCIKEGLHYLHKQFGSTNGWNRKPKAPSTPIEPGWRGRVVIAPGPRTLSLQPYNSANPT